MTVSDAPFWEKQRGGGKLTEWGREREQLERLGSIREQLLDLDPGEPKAKRLASERHRLEEALGLTPTKLYTPHGRPDRAGDGLTYEQRRERGLCVECGTPSGDTCRCSACTVRLAERRG